MAEIYSGIASNGVRYTICDDLAAAPGTEEYDRRVERQRRAAYAILVQAAKKNLTTTDENQPG